MTDADLFDGREGPPKRRGESPHAADAASVSSAGSMISQKEMAIDFLEKQLSHQTYRELYAFAIGFAPLFLGLVLGFDPLLALAVLLTVPAFGCIRSLSIVGGRVAERIVQRPNYLFFGQLVATFIGGLAVVIIRVVGFAAGLVA